MVRLELAGGGQLRRLARVLRLLLFHAAGEREYGLVACLEGELQLGDLSQAKRCLGLRLDLGLRLRLGLSLICRRLGVERGKGLGGGARRGESAGHG